jgi:MFS family permease
VLKLEPGSAIMPAPQEKTPNISVAALAGFVTLLVGIGFGRFAYSAFIPALVERRWFTVSQADYLAATTLAGYVIGAAIAGHRIWKIGASVTIRVSMLVVAGSFLCCARPFGYGWFLLWRSLSGFAGGFLMVTAVPIILARTPVERQARVNGIIFTGVGAGIAVEGTIILVMARRFLTQAWIGIGAASLILASLTWTWWRNSGNACMRQEKKSAVRPVRSRWTVRFLAMAYFASGVGLVPHSVFWVDFISRGLHQGLTAGGHYWILLGFSAAAGPLLAAWSAGRIGFERSLHLAFMSETIGVALPVFATNRGSLALSSILLGSMALGITSPAAGRVSELVAISEQKRVWSWMTTAFSIAYAVGAWGFSFLFARTSSYKALFVIGATSLLAGSLLDAAGSYMAHIPSCRSGRGYGKCL